MPTKSRKGEGRSLGILSPFRHKFYPMSKERKLWIAFLLVITVSFAILGYYGFEIYQKAPPMPSQIVTTEGDVIFEGQDIKDGQNVWQSMGGQEVGSIWGHGAYTAPDWTADWLHREALFILNEWSQEDFGKKYEELESERQALLERRLKLELRKNTYNEADQTITISPMRAKAVAFLSDYYSGLLWRILN